MIQNGTETKREASQWSNHQSDAHNRQPQRTKELVFALLHPLVEIGKMHNPRHVGPGDQDNRPSKHDRGIRRHFGRVNTIGP